MIASHWFGQKTNEGAHCARIARLEQRFRIAGLAAFSPFALPATIEESAPKTSSHHALRRKSR
jgi:hypothetical protein